MTFLTPQRLIVMLVPALLFVGYVLVRSRRLRTVVRFSSLDLAESVAPRTSAWRRWFTAVVAVAATVVLAASFARPVIAVPVPQEQATLMLAVDVSLSMEADDVPPSRLAAAQRAAAKFLEIAPDELRVGLVAFAGSALPVFAPSDDHAAIEEAISRLGLGQGTAVGEAIYSSLDQLAVDVEGETPPQAIVVLSDGETTAGRPELDAAEAAAAAGVPVYTIVFGTESGTISFEGETIPVPAAAGALQQVAERTGGQFYSTADESGLGEILAAIGSEVSFETEQREVTDWFAGLGLLLTAIAAAASLRWFGRMV